MLRIRFFSWLVIIRQILKYLSHVEGMLKISWGFKEALMRSWDETLRNISVFIVYIWLRWIKIVQFFFPETAK